MNRLIVGLGNPGKEYEKTRHNIGALAAQAYAARIGAPFHTERGCAACTAKKENAQGVVYVAYPTTYMNENGTSVGRLVRALKVSVENVLVLFDDIETKWNKMSLVPPGGGTRGHNGVRSVQEHLGSKNFAQLRIGVGHPGHDDVAAYVLDRFSDEEMDSLSMVLEKATESIDKWLGEEKIP